MQSFFNTEAAQYLASIAVKINYLEKKILQHPEIDITKLLNFFTFLNESGQNIEKRIAEIEDLFKSGNE